MINYPRNILKTYPFKNTKILPIEDIFIYGYEMILKTEDNKIYFDESFSIPIPTLTNKVIPIIKDNIQIGYIIINGVIQQPLEVNEYLCDSCCLPNTLLKDGVRSVRAEDELVTDLSLEGNLIQIGNTLNSYLAPNNDIYLRKIKIGNDYVSGKSIIINGSNLITVSGSTISTTITDPNLNCPTMFDNSLKGDRGEQGDAGENGLDGASIKDYEYDPNPCDSSCICLPSTSWCFNPYSTEVCSVNEISCEQCDTDYGVTSTVDGEINTPDVGESDLGGGGGHEGCDIGDLDDYREVLNITGECYLSEMYPNTYNDDSTVIQRFVYGSVHHNW